MARCDVGTARIAGVDCRVFYRLQAQVADQTGRFRQALHSLHAALSRGGALSAQDKVTAARLDKYMGKGTSSDHAKIALVNNVLYNAERQLRNGAALTKFDKALGSGGNTQPSYMNLGDELSTNTILHEAIHFGTQAWRSEGDVRFVPDLGNASFFSGYGSLQAALERGHYGWERTSISAASYAWTVTGP